jgi:hypothetical protein
VFVNSLPELDIKSIEGILFVYYYYYCSSYYLIIYNMGRVTKNSSKKQLVFTTGETPGKTPDKTTYKDVLNSHTSGSKIVDHIDPAPPISQTNQQQVSNPVAVNAITVQQPTGGLVIDTAPTKLAAQEFNGEVFKIMNSVNSGIQQIGTSIEILTEITSHSARTLDVATKNSAQQTAAFDNNTHKLDQLLQLLTKQFTPNESNRTPAAIITNVTQPGQPAASKAQRIVPVNSTNTINNSIKDKSSSDTAAVIDVTNRQNG